MVNDEATSPLRQSPAAAASAAATAAAVRGVNPPRAQRTPGASLVPDLKVGSTPGGAKPFWYWVGVLPSCPVEWLDVAGVNFPKVTELIAPSPGNPGKWRRIPKIGSLVPLTEDRLRLLEQRLPHKVIRFLSERDAAAEAAAVEASETAGGRLKNIGDVAQRPRKGYPITIPSEADRKALEERGRYRPFVAKQNDEPAARYIFMVLCADQTNPGRGEFYPDSLEQTGLEHPKQ